MSKQESDFVLWKPQTLFTLQRNINFQCDFVQRSLAPEACKTALCRKYTRRWPYMEVALEQGGVYDLKELLAAFDCRRALHKRGCGGGVRVIQLLH